MKQPITTFIIPSCGRDTLQRAIDSVGDNPYLVMIDDEKRGPAVLRNEMIQKATTEWVSFLDDDDTVTSDYVQRLQEEIEAHPFVDIIHFREYFLWGQVFPNWPKVEWGNVGISFSVRREIALKYPFQTEEFEDLRFVERITNEGYMIHFSPYITYHARH